MSGFADYEQYDALGLAELVRRDKVTPRDLLEAAIERVEARNPAVNAVVMKLYDYGRKAIAEGLPEGPFRGVPFLMKDLTSAVAGVPMTRGSRFFADTPPSAVDSEHVKRLKRAGLVIFGRPILRAGLVADLRAAALRADTQPLGCHPHLGRLERGRCGGGGGSHAAAGACVRRIRLDPRTGRVLWPGGPEAHPRPQHLRSVPR
jgi:amidase